MPLYNKLTIYAAKSDIARLIYLYFYGGIYLDTHIEHISKKDGNNIFSEDSSVCRVFFLSKAALCVGVLKDNESA